MPDVTQSTKMRFVGRLRFVGRMMRDGSREHRQDLIRGTSYSGGVRRDGEHYNDNASDAIGDFLGDRDRIPSLRLHPHAETNEEAACGS
jgi:hypothetical protein